MFLSGFRSALQRLALPALLGLAACAPSGLDNLQRGNPGAQARWEHPAADFAVPFDWQDGHLIVPVRVNGSAPLRFAFDTGAAATVLFETERSRDLRLAPPERELQVGARGDWPGTASRLINGVELQLGDLRLDGLTVLQIPLSNSPIFADADEAYFDGAVGYDLLRHFVTRIDYVGRTIQFFRVGGSPPPGADWQALPLDLAARVPYLRVELQDRDAPPETVSLLLDTGAPSYLYLNPELTRAVGLPTPSYLLSGRQFNGPYHRVTGRLNRLGIGSFNFDQLLAHHDRDDFRELGRGIGLLGNGVLANFDLVLDYRAQTLWLRRNSHFSTASPADRSGLDLKPHRLGARVRALANSGAASQLGMRAGDLILAIDGEPLSAASYDRLTRLLRSPREALELCWRTAANAARQCGSLRLANRL